MSIFQNLPDGAVIHREVEIQQNDDDQSLKEENKPDMSVESEKKLYPGESGEKTKIELRYQNTTFQNMFTKYREHYRNEQENEQVQRQNDDDESQMRVHSQSSEADLKETTIQKKIDHNK